MVVDGYGLVNLRAGFRWSDGWSVFLWSRNLLDKQYYEFLSAQPGNSGLIVGPAWRSTNGRRDAADGARQVTHRLASTRAALTA